MTARTDDSSPDAREGATRSSGAEEKPPRSRRDFLKAGSLAAAGLLVGGTVGGAAGAVIGNSSGASETFGAPHPRSVPGFDHMVVLMGENRSFDNLLGWLYSKEDLPEGKTFEGLAFGDYSNTSAAGVTVPAHVYQGETDVVMGSPNPDPGEEYPHVNTQLFDLVSPKSNARLWVESMEHPFNAPSPGQEPTMSGFLNDYIINIERLQRGKEATPEQAAQIMGGFSPEMMPVLSTLAREFAVFDNWFAAVPSQTYCNRSFFHASTSHGYVTNKHGGGYNKWLDAEPSPTIFNRLEEAGIDWKIYFDADQLISMTGMMHAPVLQKYWKTGHFAYMEDFYADCRHGTLPAYSFIEPRMIYNHNDFHPPFGVFRSSVVDGALVIDSAVSDVRAGEALVAKVYDAIRTSRSAKGSNALNTMLLITFDEHGGTYDHVPPPAAIPPTATDEPGEMGFRFDRLGLRVPAIAVSAYTAPNTIIHDEMHHAAVISTLCRLHGLEPLTRRDVGAADLFRIVNLEEPREPETWPRVQPAYVPPQLDDDELHDLQKSHKPLSPPAKGLLGILLARFGPADAPEPTSYADAYNTLREHGLGLFTEHARS